MQVIQRLKIASTVKTAGTILQDLMYGIAPEATLVVKKVLATELECDDTRFREFHRNALAQAFSDAVDEVCHVLNISLGFRRRTESGELISRRFLSNRFSHRMNEM